MSAEDKAQFEQGKVAGAVSVPVVAGATMALLSILLLAGVFSQSANATNNTLTVQPPGTCSGGWPGPSVTLSDTWSNTSPQCSLNLNATTYFGGRIFRGHCSRFGNVAAKVLEENKGGPGDCTCTKDILPVRDSGRSFSVRGLAK